MDFSIKYKYVCGVSQQRLIPHRQDNRNLFCCLALGVWEGEYCVKIGTETIRIQPGQTIIVPEFTKHDIWVEKNSLISFAHFSCRIFTQDVLSFMKDSYILFDNVKMLEYIDRMNEKTQSLFTTNLHQDAAIADFICAVLKHSGKTDREIFFLQNEPWLLDVLQFIQDNVHNQIRAEDLIAVSKYSKASFYNKFVQAMKCSPNVYILSKKLQCACALLLQDYSVSETARKIGFLDDAYFCKVFKKNIGIVPSAYKKQFVECSSESLKINCVIQSETKNET